MHEDVFVVALACNESEALGIVKPLDCTLFHFGVFLCRDYSLKTGRCSRQCFGLHYVRTKTHSESSVLLVYLFWNQMVSGNFSFSASFWFRGVFGGYCGCYGRS